MCDCLHTPPPTRAQLCTPPRPLSSRHPPPRDPTNAACPQHPLPPSLLDSLLGDSVLGDVSCIIVGLTIVLWIRLSGAKVATSFWPPG